MMVTETKSDNSVTEELTRIFERAKQEAVTLIAEAQAEISPPDLLEVDEVAARLKTNRQAVYRLARTKKLPAVNLGERTLRWTEEVVSSFIAENLVGGSEKE